MRVRRKYIRSIVERLLINHPFNGHSVPVDKIAYSLGIDVRSTRPGDVSLSGFLVRDDGTGKAIIGVNEDHNKNRRRFTIAHEVGHFLLHTGQEIYVDECSKAGLMINLRDENSSKGTDGEEKEANFFAAELLMPVEFLRKDIASYNIIGEDGLKDMLDELAKTYEVSKEALTYRLMNLGYIHL